MVLRTCFPVVGIILLTLILVSPVCASHNVTFVNTCNQDVYINVQGGPQGTCDNNGNACSGCEVCGTDTNGNPIVCNTSASTGNTTPLCCPGVTDYLYCYTGQACTPGGCCPGIPATAGQSYSCPGAGDAQKNYCGNTSMTQAQVDALSGYNNPSTNKKRPVCNGSISEGGGFKLDADTGTKSLTLEDFWNGAFFARTDCTFDQNGIGSCATGNCQDVQNRGLFQCGGAGSHSPATKAEVNFDSGGIDNYDISYVNGFNIAMVFEPTQYNPSYTGPNMCTPAGCAVGLSEFNSTKVADWNVLKYPSASNFIGIMDDCDYFKATHDVSGAVNGPNAVNISLWNGYCCPVAAGYVNDSSHCGNIPAGQTCKICAGQDMSRYPFNTTDALPNSARLFLDTCPAAYAYTYNDSWSLMTCQGNASVPTNYKMSVSCPGSSQSQVQMPAPTITSSSGQEYVTSSPTQKSGFSGGFSVFIAVAGILIAAAAGMVHRRRR